MSIRQTLVVNSGLDSNPVKPLLKINGASYIGQSANGGAQAFFVLYTGADATIHITTGGDGNYGPNTSSYENWASRGNTGEYQVYAYIEPGDAIFPTGQAALNTWITMTSTIAAQSWGVFAHSGVGAITNYIHLHLAIRSVHNPSVNIANNIIIYLEADNYGLV